HSLRDARVRVRAIGRLLDEAMLSHQQAMHALQTVSFLETSRNLKEDCVKLQKPERPDGPEKLKSLQSPDGSANPVCNGRMNLEFARDCSFGAEGQSSGGRDCDGGKPVAWLSDAEKSAILEQEQVVGEVLAKVDEQLRALHDMLKNITCVCNKASNGLPPKWFEEGSEDLRGGGGGGGEAVIAAAAAAAAAAVAGSIGNKVRLVLVEDVVTRMQEQQRQQKQVEDLKGIKGRVTHSSSQRHEQLHEEQQGQQQEQQEELIAAAEVGQLKEKLGSVSDGSLKLEAEVNTQRSWIDENEK
ncbi:unnamed protein product, partial [Closterium sp. Naga37s-1]